MTFLLGGYQTDFARNWKKEGKEIADVIEEVVAGGLAACDLPAADVGVGHVANFAAELYAMQGQLGGFLVQTQPEFAGLPTSRHEAACASGSVAVLAATAELEAGRYDLAMVVGIEQMKTVDSARGGDFLGTAGWYERESKGVDYPFPSLFGRLGDEYERRFGLKNEHLKRISEINFGNAKRNPLAQTRAWGEDADKMSQTIAGRIDRKSVV